MSYTEHYGLYLTDSATETFLDWRDHINGPLDSNMIIIDNALADKADHPMSLDLTLHEDGWTGSSAPYTQILHISELTSDQNGIIGLDYAADEEQRDAARRALLSVGYQEDAMVTIIADGVVPTIDIPLTVILYN